MQRILFSALMLGVTGLFTGCGDESGSKVKESTTGPGGTTTTTSETKVKSTGDNPPPNASGETGKTAAPGAKP